MRDTYLVWNLLMWGRIKSQCEAAPDSPSWWGGWWRSIAGCCLIYTPSGKAAWSPLMGPHAVSLHNSSETQGCFTDWSPAECTPRDPFSIASHPRWQSGLGQVHVVGCRSFKRQKVPIHDKEVASQLPTAIEKSHCEQFNPQKHISWPITVWGTSQAISSGRWQ